MLCMMASAQSKNLPIAVWYGNSETDTVQHLPEGRRACRTPCADQAKID